VSLQIANNPSLDPPSYTQPDNALGLSTPISPTSQQPQRQLHHDLPTNPAKIRARLHDVSIHQNEVDAGLDTVDLRQLMRAALQTSNDVQMIEVLQVGREEMPEAIKALQRALEREVEKEGSASGSGGSSAMLPPGRLDLLLLLFVVVVW